MGIHDGGAGSGQDFEAEVAAAFDSVVVLLGQHGPRRGPPDLEHRDES